MTSGIQVPGKDFNYLCLMFSKNYSGGFALSTIDVEVDTVLEFMEDLSILR